jgi:hypothetical protein
VEHDLKDLQPHDGSQVQLWSFIELGISGDTDMERGDVTYHM